MKTVIAIASMLACAWSASATAQTTLYQGAGTDLVGTITPDITTQPGRNVSFLVTFNPSSTANANSNLQGGVLINEFAGGYPDNPSWYDSQFEVENDGTVLASVFSYQYILNLGKAKFGQDNVASFAYDATTGTFSGMLNGVLATPYVAGSDVRTAPFDVGNTDVYYGIGTNDGTNLGSGTAAGYDPTNSSNGQAFDGTISSVTIDDSGQLLQPAVAAVPEPATWAMMILGIGAAGGALRRRRGTARAAVA